MSNLPSIEDIAKDGALADHLPLDVLRDILAAIAAKALKVNAPLTGARSAINASIAKRVNADITAGYLAKGVDTGVLHIERDGLDVVVDRSKTVTWDQARLASIMAAMVTAGDDPSEYVKTAYSVSETAYGAWPSMIRRIFEPARTVKPGAASIKLADLKQEAA